MPNPSKPTESKGRTTTNPGLVPKLAHVPQTKAEAAREALLDLVPNAKSRAGEVLADFRAADRYFKYKLAIVAAWVLVSAATLFISCPSAVQAPTNALQARVRVEKMSTLDRDIISLYIENRSEQNWHDVLLKLNDVYSAAIPVLGAHRSAVVQLDKFSSAEGRTPPRQMRPQKLVVRCSAGEVTLDNLHVP